MAKTTDAVIERRKLILKCFICLCAEAHWNSVVYCDDHRVAALRFVTTEGVWLDLIITMFRVFWQGPFEVFPIKNQHSYPQLHLIDNVEDERLKKKKRYWEELKKKKIGKHSIGWRGLW